ncbi:MAG: hypothetical protein EKK48_15985 [Candidatus Melainabacteria bacterium]|nr:MAG: hypothetical protein EKK48_15985 [Candidatus Melainabacteria bacterium]
MRIFTQRTRRHQSPQQSFWSDWQQPCVMEAPEFCAIITSLKSSAKLGAYGMNLENNQEEPKALAKHYCFCPRQFMKRQNRLTARKLVAPLVLALAIVSVQPGVSSSNGDLFLRLQTTRDALLTQERDIRKSYDDVTRQIDELRQKQALLDSYLTQTRNAIRDVERAMGSAQ